MHALSTLKSRLSSRPDSEHEQAILRIVIVGAIWAYMGLLATPATAEARLHHLLVMGLAVFFAIAVGIFVCIVLRPAPNILRRGIGMLADTGGATFYMCLGEEYGASMIAVYLFVTFGNGFRFGRRHLFVCQGLALIGLVSVLSLVPFWQEHRPIGIGLLISLIVLPLYVSTLLKRIQEARQRAEEANQAKTAFLANMSHEMRTPLNGIVGVADLLTTTSLTNQQADLVRLLKHSVKVLRSLVDDVLDISKIEAGRLTVEMVSFDLHALVGELIELLKPNAESKSLILRSQIDPALDYQLRGDSHHLRQVLLNLLGNALKFTDSGQVALTIKCLRESSDAFTVRFEARDTGIGIAPEAVQRIFERFVQADQSTTRRFGGTGLGTTIAKQLVEHMGGTIGVESAVGVGSTFWFEIPLLRDRLADRRLEEPENSLSIVVAPLDNAQAAVAYVEQAGFRTCLIHGIDELEATVVALRSQGQPIAAVVMFTGVQDADLTVAAVRRLLPGKVAFVRVATDDPAQQQIPPTGPTGQVAVLGHTSPARYLRNAIHAATVELDDTEQGSVDLADTLREQRLLGRILVADDNLTNQSIVRELLTKAGHEVVIANNGEEALDLYESSSPDLALLDFNMPLRTGCEVIKAIRVMERPGSHVPAIILSASVTPEAKDWAIRSGADAFVGKPFDAKHLLATIDRLLRDATSNLAALPTINEIDKSERAESYKDPASLINWPRVQELEEIAQNAYFITELLRGFRDDSERLLVEIQLRANTGDKMAIADAIHALKGAALGVGARVLGEKCKSLEEALKTESLSPAHLQQAALDMQTVYEATLKELDSYMMDRHHVTVSTA